MHRKCLHKLLALTALTLLFGILSSKAYPVEKVRNIIIIFSLSPDLPAYHNILSGIKSTIANTREPNNIIIEYLDIGRSKDDVYARNIVDIYNNKFKDIPIDLLITIGPGLSQILLKLGLNALKDSPVIDIDLDNYENISSDLLSNNNRKELLVRLRFDKTIKTALGLFPEFRNLYVIAGSSKIDQFFNSLVLRSKEEIGKDYVFKFISGISMDSTIKYVRQIPAESIIIVPSYSSDINKIPFTIPEVISVISLNSKAPVFPMTDSFIGGNGGIGGYIFSYTNLGKEAGRVAGEMLNGTVVSNITVNESSFYQNIFNWQELKKWNIVHSKNIPADSLYFNDSTSFLLNYKYFFLAIFILLISETALIAYLYKLNKRQKKISEKMMETEYMHAELVRNYRMAKMTELAASLAHELNQPLTAILYSAQAGKRFLEQDKLDRNQANEIFDCIIDDDKRAGKIINSVRNLMRPEAREHEKINLNILIQETKDIIQSEAIRKNIKINLVFSATPVFIFGDKIQLQQVLMNLIKNSFNAMDESFSKNRVIGIHLILNKNSVLVSVRDNGPGFDPLLREKLFQPFVTTRKNGSGIGLALSKTIIENHKGKIWAENIDGGGADFSFTMQTIKEP